MGWLLLVVGFGYFTLSAAALYLRKSANIADFLGSAILTATGIFGLNYGHDSGLPFTLMLAGLVVGITFLGWSMRRWSARTP